MKNGGLSTRNFVIVLFRFNIYNGARPSETVPAGTQVILYSKFYALFQYVVGSMHDNWKNNFHFPPQVAESSVYAKPPDARSPKVSFDYCVHPCTLQSEGTQHLWKILNTVEPSVSNHPKCKDLVVAYVRLLLTRMDGQVVSSKNGS